MSQHKTSSIDGCDFELENNIKLSRKVHKRMSGHEFLHYCRMPLYFFGRMRKMRNGDTFFLGQIRKNYASIINFNFEGVLELSVVKEERGLYRAVASFCLLTKPTRSHRFHEFTFMIEKGGIIAFTGDEKLSLYQRRGFALCCRYFQRLIRNADDTDTYFYNKHSLPWFLNGVSVDKNNTCVEPVHFQTEDGDEKLVRWELQQKMMPKSMMECIVDYGIASGLIFNK